MQAQADIENGFFADRILSSADYRTVFRLWPDMFCLADSDGTVLDVNPACERILGYTRQEMIGKNWEAFSHPDDAERTRRKAASQLDGEQVINFVNRYRTKSGGYRFIQWQGLSTASGYLVGIGRDITDEVQRSELLAKVAQNERYSASAALHDGVSQQLFGLRMIANQLRKALESAGSELTPRAALMEQVAHDALQSVRNVMDGLGPCSKNASDFHDTLRSLVERISNLYNLECTCRIGVGELVLRSDIASQLYLIIQEAVMNAVKHAAARRIEIYARKHNGAVSVNIEDDGKGISEKAKKAGYGISIMRDRAILLGATLDICTGASGGTVVSCRWEKFPPSDD